MSKLTHVDDRGDARMVDVSAKPPMMREAVASGEVLCRPETIALIQANGIAKGNVFATARIAGIAGAKRTPELIPLCHSLYLTHVDVDFQIAEDRTRIFIKASAKTTAQTGVEMEALTAVAVAGLTIYDMCKAADKTMVISQIVLVSKTKQPAAPA